MLAMMITRNRGLWLILALGLTGGLAACSDSTDPEIEKAARLELSTPGTVVAGEPFSLTITAVGTQGTRPFTSVEGEVELTVSVGAITPTTATLIAGEATVQATLSAADGQIQVGAVHETVGGTGDVTVASLRTLPGNDNDKASGAIPDLDYHPSADEFSDTYPGFEGSPVATNILLVNFSSEATVAGANAVLAKVDGAIVGGVPGSTSGRGGVLMFKIPFATHAAVDSVITAIQGEPSIAEVSRDMGLQGDFVPDSGDPPIGDWVWEPGPEGGNWGLELIRAPQMWNLNPGMVKKPGSLVNTGIVDMGFENHLDLRFHVLGGSGVHDHGNHVAGTIGASFHNGMGVDGVNPFAEMHVVSPIFLMTEGVVLHGINKLAGFGCRVINVSIGREWPDHHDDSPVGRIFSTLSARVFQSSLEHLKEAGTMPLVVMAAGNQTDDFGRPFDAKWGSSANYAALELGMADILVVEALEEEEGGRLAGYSNYRGHVSAPGSKVLSTVLTNVYNYKNGTSMAAPHVTGLASYLLSIDPSLTNDQLIGLIRDNSVTAADNGPASASNRIDAFASALAIDGIRGDAKVVKMLLDIDDGTEDGNRRLSYDDPPVDFEAEDEDGDGSTGDGAIDMADFRRWRDWYHQTAQTPGLILDGRADHPKKDVNGNRKVEAPGKEDVYPRADFNGDGTLDLAAKAVVPGDFTEPQSDFEVLMRYIDPIYPQDLLESWIFSGDIHVDLIQLATVPGVDKLVSRVVTASGDIIEEHTHSKEETIHVYTVENGTVYDVTAFGIAGGDTICELTEAFQPGLCEDAYWTPVCEAGPVELALTAHLPEIVEPGTPFPLFGRAGTISARGDTAWVGGIDIDLQPAGGTVSQASVVTDSEGNWEVEATMDPVAEHFTVFVTATLDGGLEKVIQVSNKPTVFMFKRLTSANVMIGYNPLDGTGNQQENDGETDRATAGGTVSLSGNLLRTFDGDQISTSANVTSTVSRAGDTVTITANGDVSWEWIHDQAPGDFMGTARAEAEVHVEIGRPVSYDVGFTTESAPGTFFDGAEIEITSSSLGVVFLRSTIQGSVGSSSGILEPGSYQIEGYAHSWTPEVDKTLGADFMMNVVLTPVE